LKTAGLSASADLTVTKAAEAQILINIAVDRYSKNRNTPPVALLSVAKNSV
jgi:hypothetical protein